MVICKRLNLGSLQISREGSLLSVFVVSHLSHLPFNRKVFLQLDWKFRTSLKLCSDAIDKCLMGHVMFFGQKRI